MLLSEFACKKIINIYDGGILGLAGDSDLLIDPDNGGIEENNITFLKGIFIICLLKERHYHTLAGGKKDQCRAIVVDIDEDDE